MTPSALIKADLSIIHRSMSFADLLRPEILSISFSFSFLFFLKIIPIDLRDIESHETRPFPRQFPRSNAALLAALNRNRVDHENDRVRHWQVDNVSFDQTYARMKRTYINSNNRE